ncbi:M48 family metallopeptidase [Aeromicrobium sp.]|nr:M48 family metallopeptidase [Candidatus Saccharibacteria bacterium]
MAVKQFAVPDLGVVYVYKRAGAKSLRLTIRSDGSVRVTIPAWSPYAAGVQFAQSRSDWIRQHATGPKIALVDGQHIGKSHRLQFVPVSGTSKPTSRVRQISIVVSYPKDVSIQDDAVQTTARTASLRALKVQATRLLPLRVKELADKHGFRYKSVTVKSLKSRWGSCDQDTNITLNLYLMQLPWHLIDYVILHELTHTRIMQHGPLFWSAMQTLEPSTQALRHEIKAHKTTLQ